MDYRTLIEDIITILAAVVISYMLFHGMITI